MDGILNLDKPQGLTSHDVVARVRAVARQRRVGHAGTLDPLASGVLVVCLGRATRLAEYLMASPKRYWAEARLGVATDSYDAAGQVVAERPVRVSREEVEAALERFRGTILQVPPMVSALKRDGKRLYELARQGIEVERAARPVEISELKLASWAPPDLALEVTCSAGTYVRSLVHDLGQLLGCGAHVTALVRLASGDFRLEDALPLAELTPERLPSALLPLDAGLGRYPALHLDERAARAVRLGQTVPAEGAAAGLARAYGPDGALLAMLAYMPEKGVWQPRKVLV